MTISKYIEVDIDVDVDIHDVIEFIEDCTDREFDRIKEACMQRENDDIPVPSGGLVIKIPVLNYGDYYRAMDKIKEIGLEVFL